MAKSPEAQQRTDAERIADAGTGKLDKREPAQEPETRGNIDRGAEATDTASARERLRSVRQTAIEQLRALGVSPDLDATEPREGTDVVRDEGDAAQASERQDMNFATRQRLAARINQLTAALERIQQGHYGACAECGRPIEAARLAAVPESELCLACQERRERAPGREAAA